MASVDKTVNGEKIQRFIARQEDVQKALTREARIIATKAQASLLGHKQENNAVISVEKGDIDRWVTLNDPNAKSSPGAAWAIEHGHLTRGGKSWVPGLFILHDAAKLPHP